jgi:hypothetical protein
LPRHTRGRAGSERTQTPVLGPRARGGEAAASENVSTSSASAFGTTNPVSHFLIRTAVKHARNPYDTELSRFPGTIKKCTPPCASESLPLVSTNSPYARSNLRQSFLSSSHAGESKGISLPGTRRVLDACPRVLGVCSRVLGGCTGAASESARANVFSEFSGKGISGSRGRRRGG